MPPPVGRHHFQGQSASDRVELLLWKHFNAETRSYASSLLLLRMEPWKLRCKCKADFTSSKRRIQHASPALLLMLMTAMPPPVRGHHFHVLAGNHNR
eukprot:614843-Amphidinium_carterae.1